MEETKDVSWACGNLITQEFEIDPVKVGCGFNFSVKCGTCMSEGSQLLRYLITDNRSNEEYRQALNVSWVPVNKIKWFAEIIYEIICQTITEAQFNNTNSIKNLSLKNLINTLT